jgi:hypothetical protein
LIDQPKRTARRKIAHDDVPPSEDDVYEAQRRVVSDPPRQRYPAPKTVRVSSLASDFAVLDIRPRPVLRRLSGAPPRRVDPDEESREDPLSLRTALNRYCTTASRRPSPEPGYRSRSPSPGPSRRAEPPTLPIPIEHDPSPPMHAQTRTRVPWLPETLGVSPVRKHPRPYIHSDIAEEPLLQPPAKLAHGPARSRPKQTSLDLVEDIPKKLKPSLKPHRPPPASPSRDSDGDGDDAPDPGNTSGVTALTTVTLPIGTTRPRRLASAPLKPQTHHVSHGLLRILPSLELLVDFRAGERLRGKRADAVLVVSADGTAVRVCRGLPEPLPDAFDFKAARTLQLYAPDDLPRRFWKTWNDAEKLIEHLKQRTPRVRAGI